MNSREKKIVNHAARIHSALIVKYICWSTFLGFAAGVLLMWLLEKFG